MGALRALRVGTWPLAQVYGLAMRLRNLGYAHGLFTRHHAGARVVSVGNLTVGGSGKTPLVAWLVERALAAGTRVGVVARGYGRGPGAALNDEGAMLEARFPGLPQEQDPDRVAACARLLGRTPLDILILDDGFQHRRLARDFDLVCVDATRALGSERMLPCGDLREPVTGLARADAVVLTRAGRLDRSVLADRRSQVRRAAGRDLPVFTAEHAPRDIVEHPSGRVESPEMLRGRAVELLSAIARPDAFEHTVAGLGADIRVHHRFRDHHRHVPAEVESLARAAAARDCLLVTTEKDAVKLGAVSAPFHALRIVLRFFDSEPAPRELGLS